LRLTGRHGRRGIAIKDIVVRLDASESGTNFGAEKRAMDKLEFHGLTELVGCALKRGWLASVSDLDV
jgi:hypothetical protein